MMGFKAIVNELEENNALCTSITTLFACTLTNQIFNKKG
jgi:hypothetical protein